LIFKFQNETLKRKNVLAFLVGVSFKHLRLLHKEVSLFCNENLDECEFICKYVSSLFEAPFLSLIIN